MLVQGMQFPDSVDMTSTEYFCIFYPEHTALGPNGIHTLGDRCKSANSHEWPEQFLFEEIGVALACSPGTPSSFCLDDRNHGNVEAVPCKPRSFAPGFLREKEFTWPTSSGVDGRKNVVCSASCAGPLTTGIGGQE